MKDAILYEIKEKSLEGLNRRMEMAEERVNDLADRYIEMIQSEDQKKKLRNSGTGGTKTKTKTKTKTPLYYMCS